MQQVVGQGQVNSWPRAVNSVPCMAQSALSMDRCSEIVLTHEGPGVGELWVKSGPQASHERGHPGPLGPPHAACAQTSDMFTSLVVATMAIYNSTVIDISIATAIPSAVAITTV